jgi:hypothetical protein
MPLPDLFHVALVAVVLLSLEQETGDQIGR